MCWIDKKYKLIVTKYFSVFSELHELELEWKGVGEKLVFTENGLLIKSINRTLNNVHTVY